MFICGDYQESNNFHKTRLKEIEYAKSEFDSFKIVIYTFNFVHMNIK